MSEGYEEPAPCFEHLAKDKNVCPDVTESEFRSAIGYNFCLFDVRYQNRFSAPHSVKATFGVTAEIEDSSYAGFDLVLNY